jgi:carbonic anhydrase/acetyltransferase-like protein (isoleucine patch superfamily)
MRRGCWAPDLGPRLIAIDGKAPRIADDAFVAPGCSIVGDVEIGAEASLWYNCVVRGDVNRVTIGARTNIQDGSTIHCDSPAPGQPDGWPTIIGADCLVGHMVLLHGCTLHDRAFVGMGATVMNGATIESDGMLAAGALLTPGKTIGAGQLWAGRPAKYLRDLTPEEIAANRAGVAHYVENARRHAAAIRDA